MFFLSSALAHADVGFVHNDGPQWRELTAENSSGMPREVVVDGRRILDREKKEGLELVVLDG